MLNKNLLVVSGVAVVSGAIGFGASKLVKGIKTLTGKKKRESEVLQILKKCISEETDYCVSVNMIDASIRNEVVDKIYKDSAEVLKNSTDFNTVLEMSDEDIYKQLKDSMKQSRVLYAMYGFCA